MRMAWIFFFVVSVTFSVVFAGDSGKTMGTTVVLEFNGEKVIVSMNDSQASRDFVAMLPLTLTFRDYNSTEKVSDLPKRLSTEGSPDGYDPSVGDFTYYAPWNNLALFYRDFQYSAGLVPLGVIESGMEKFTAAQGEISIRFDIFK